MSETRLPDYLDHLREAARQACGYIEGMDEAAFLTDKRTQQAVILNIVIIGDGNFLERHPDVPWRNMKGMCNRIAHGYFDIDLHLVWETVRTALPELLERLPALLEDCRDRP
jgi:uncharacterized protein with HEPN domain